VYSHALQRKERVLVYLPPGYATSTRRYPVAIFLHGTPGTPEGLVSLGIPERLDALIAAGTLPPLVAAFPAGSDDPSTDTEWGDSSLRRSERWETFVAEDVVRFLSKAYRVSRTRTARAIAGLSMGGYGAMNIALHHPSEFGVVESWSGYFNANTPAVFAPGSRAWQANSPQAYVPSVAPALRRLRPQISFYVGTADRFFGENVRFARLLTHLGVRHDFEAVRGAGHTSTLWRSGLDRELLFIGRAFRQ
jgi:enterochelin esterase-like enzyme